jgi:glycosyltransferase involved in cell wall biosynthesis
MHEAGRHHASQTAYSSSAQERETSRHHSLCGGLRTKAVASIDRRGGKPLVSVITVVRNGRQHLEETLHSVLLQTYENIEYIIIDGASVDGTIDLIRKYDDRVAYWVSEPDAGIYDAMNKGVALSTGEWILFLNVGDRFYSPDVVKTLIDGRRSEDELLFGHCEYVYPSGFSLIWRVGSLRDLWKGMIFRHQSLFTKATVFKDISFDTSYRISGDYAFVYACFRKNRVFHAFDVIVSSVRLGGLSDEHIVHAIRENYSAVHQYDCSFKVQLYYRWLILFHKAKLRLKHFLPDSITNRIRLLNYK